MNRKAIAANRRLVSELLTVSSLNRTLDRATPAEWAEGLAWYPEANNFARTLADRHNLPLDTVAGVIAVISPQQQWAVNQALASELLSDPTNPRDFGLGLGSNRAKLMLQNPEGNPLDILGGPKVRSFYRNITEPRTPGAVTIDRHAVAILAGMDTPAFLTAHPKLLDRVTVYRQCAAIYRAAARARNILPQECQAIAWVTHRNSEFVEPF